MEKLTNFKKEVHGKNQIIDNILWHYYDEGNHDKCIILLPGTAGRAQLYFEYILDLKKDYRVIALDYPPVRCIKDFIEGFEELLALLNVTNFSIFSNSFGGILSQVITRKMPDRVEGLFLAHVSTKTKNISSQDIYLNTKSYKKQITAINGFLNFMNRMSFRKRIKVQVDSSSISNRKFWRKFYLETFNTTTDDIMLGVYYSILDFWENYEVSPDEYENYNGKVVIFETTKDKLKDLKEYQEVKTLFRNSEVVKIEGKRNMSLVNYKDIFIKHIKNEL